MKKPYTLHFDSPPIITEEQTATDCTYQFLTAEDILRHSFRKADFTIQRLNFGPFYIDQLELKTRRSFHLRYTVSEARHLLFGMLRGNVRLMSKDKYFLACLRRGHLSLLYHPPGEYSIQVNPGRYVGLCVSLGSDWLSDAAENQPVLQHYLSHLPLRPGSAIPSVKINEAIHRNIEAIFAIERNGKTRLDSLLRLNFSEIIEQYCLLAPEKSDNPAYLAKKYIDHHYCSEDLNPNLIAEELSLDERTLRNRFKTEFTITPWKYYTSLRMLRAAELMQEHNLPASEVYDLVGYRDVSTFRLAKKKYHL